MFRVASALACVAAIASPRASLAEEVPPSPLPAPVEAPPAAPMPPPTRSRVIEIEVPGERTTNNKLIVGGIAAAGVIASALGVYWHLDSRDAANEVSADAFTGEAWTSEKVGLVDRADRSKTRATVAYAIGGALLIGAIATYILTEPESETSVIRTGGVAITPVPDGGGLVTKLWSF